jgi:methylmalonyl-CoA mutase
MDAKALVKDVEFPPADRPRWMALVDKAISGETYEAAMIARTDDGIAIDPLVERKRDPSPLPRRDAAMPWTVVQRCDDPDPARANVQALDDVENGATGLSMVFEGAPNAFGFGLPASPETLDRVLDGVALNKVHLRADAHPSSRAMADHMVAFLTRKRADPARLSLSFGIDSAAVFASTGRLRMSIAALQASMPQSLAHFFALGVPGILLEADGRVYHNAGATEAQELGAMLAGAVGHLRLFEEARQALVYAAPHIGFATAVDQDFFLSMAKIRALRLLWQRAQEVCAIPPSPATIHAETSYRMMTGLDAETNILRGTLAAFAAGCGGADSIAVLPHTVTHGLADPSARRIARNTQLVLRDESHIDFVADPASGSGSVEALTQSLCEAAWAEFQAIEREGGLLTSLLNGHLQARIEAARLARQTAYKTGQRGIVGTTLFAAATERPVATIAAERHPLPTDGAVFCRRLAALRIDETLGAPA